MNLKEHCVWWWGERNPQESLLSTVHGPNNIENANI